MHAHEKASIEVCLRALWMHTHLISANYDCTQFVRKHYDARKRRKSLASAVLCCRNMIESRQEKKKKKAVMLVIGLDPSHLYETNSVCIQASLPSGIIFFIWGQDAMKLACVKFFWRQEKKGTVTLTPLWSH